MAPDGDFIIAEISGSSEGGGTNRFIYGTGKWKGRKGEIKVKRITGGKPITQGTDQFCEEHKGGLNCPNRPKIKRKAQVEWPGLWLDFDYFEKCIAAIILENLRA